MIPTNKNIAVLHPYLNKKGGAVNMMIYLSNFLSNNNNVKLYTLSYDKNVFPLRENKFEIISFPFNKIHSFIKIAYIIRKSDYIFIGNSPMHFVGVISKIFFRSNAKLIWWHHHYPWYYSLNTTVYIKFKKTIEKCIIKSIDCVIVNSKYLQDSIKDIYKINSKILYPVLDKKFLDYKAHPLTPSLVRRGENPKVIFTYGRWVKGKNLEMIFKTYEALKNKVPNLILIIGGDGEEITKYKNKYKCEESVKFLGSIDKIQIIKNLEQSSLFLFPSKIDSFGLVILESMSIGVPVISYNIFGAKEIIKDGINGYLVNSDSEFIKRSYEILTIPSIRKNLSIGSIKTANTFTDNTFNKQLSKIF